MSKFYITTAIHYVNDLPHIGHIYENVVADVIARHRRAMGDDVYFLTGTDEHGQKIERSAAMQGVLPIELADRVVAVHKELWKTLAISNDDFIRTTETRHRFSVYEIIRRITANNPGDIYLGEHSGWYCSSEETFVPESQVEGGKCEEGHPVEWTTEKNFFFRLSRYQQPLLDFYRANPDFVQPETRYNEVISFVESGLRDLSVSRTAISWGIPFPGHPDHVVYVWLDALTNYVSALEFGADSSPKFDRYWPADLHLIGKDILRFHAVYWPAFLMAAAVPPPKKILAHGWWLRDNQKISKSTGNIVRPDYIIRDFGPDPLRYFLLREMVFGQDQNYSDEAFLARYNADLANDLGNTLARALKMCHSYFDGRTPPTPCEDNELLQVAAEAVPEYLREMDRYAFQRALDSVWKLLNAINGYIVGHEPWRHYKEHGADVALSRVIWNTLESLRIVWTMMAPFMPRLSIEALRRLGAETMNGGQRAFEWGNLPTNVPIETGDPLFPRVDAAHYFQSEDTHSEGGHMTDEKSATQEAEGTHAGPPPETTQAMPPDAGHISIEQFFEIDLRVAEVIAAEKIEKSRKLLKLRVSTGDEERTLVAGIAAKYAPEELVGRKVVIVANLQPATLMGVESNGMILAASIGGEPSLLSVDSSVPAGTKVR